MLEDAIKYINNLSSKNNIVSFENEVSIMNKALESYKENESINSEKNLSTSQDYINNLSAKSTASKYMLSMTDNETDKSKEYINKLSSSIEFKNFINIQNLRLKDITIQDLFEDISDPFQKSLLGLITLRDYFELKDGWYTSLIDKAGKEWWENTNSFDPNVEIKPKWHKEKEKIYLSRYNDTNDIVGINTKYKYVPSSTEEQLIKYYDTTNIALQKSSGTDPKPLILKGIQSSIDDFVDAINDNNEGYNSNMFTDAFQSVKASWTKTGYPRAKIKIQVLEDVLVRKSPFWIGKSDSPGWGFADRFPTIYYKSFSYGYGCTQTFYTTEDILNVSSYYEFLKFGMSGMLEDELQKKYIRQHQIHTPTEAKKSTTKKDLMREKYNNSAIQLLIHSMPDFMPNMFSIYITSYIEKPSSLLSRGISLYNSDSRTNMIFSENKSVNKHSELPAGLVGQPVDSTDFETRTYLERYVNARTLAFRIGSINIPQPKTSEAEISFLNAKIKTPNQKVEMSKQASMTIRLDQNLYFVDRFQRLAGVSTLIENKGLPLHVVPFNHIGQMYSLINPTNDQLKHNIYVTIDDDSLMPNRFINNLKRNRKNIYSEFDAQFNSSDGLRPMEIYSSGNKLSHTPMYCFEDVRFLGTDQIEFNSTSSEAMETNTSFIFKRMYKFYCDNASSPR